jgi:hypothetical protein
VRKVSRYRVLKSRMIHLTSSGIVSSDIHRTENWSAENEGKHALQANIPGAVTYTGVFVSSFSVEADKPLGYSLVQVMIMMMMMMSNGNTATLVSCTVEWRVIVGHLLVWQYVTWFVMQKETRALNRSGCLRCKLRNRRVTRVSRNLLDLWRSCFLNWFSVSCKYSRG